MSSVLSPCTSKINDQRSKDTFDSHTCLLLIGSHGASKHVQILHFPVGDQAIYYIRTDCQCNSVVGLMGPLPDGYDHAGYTVSEDESSGMMHFRSEREELSRLSFPVDVFAFSRGNVCFAVSKDRQGLPLSLARLCDSFVHIPHMNLYTGDEPLLDTPSCLSILLHEFANWAGYNEREFQGHKFDVTTKRIGCGTKSDDDDAKHNERAVAKAKKDDAAESLVRDAALGTFFGVGNNGDY
jgi:hypothetical protein